MGMVTKTISVSAMTAEAVEVTEVGPNLYRLDEEAALFLGAGDDEDVDDFPRYGDVFYATPTPDGKLRLESIHQRAPLRRYTFSVTEHIAASTQLAGLLKRVTDEGGHWERHMGGIVFISLPTASTMNPLAEMQKWSGLP